MNDLQMQITDVLISSYRIGNTGVKQSEYASMDDTLAKYTERMRTALGLKQNQLADRSDLPATTINRIEKGVTKLPSAFIRRKLAEGLGVSHLDILIAAGELTRDEAESGGIQQRDELSGIPPLVVTALWKIKVWTSWHTSQMLRQVDNMIELEGIVTQAAIDTVESLGGTLGDGGEIQFPNVEDAPGDEVEK